MAADPQLPPAGHINAELQLDQPMQDPRHELALNIVRTASLMTHRGSVIFRQYGLTEAQFNVLFALKYKLSAWSQSDLGKRLVVTRASITSVLDKLEEKGLVVREAVPENRRIYHVELTAAGREMLEKIEPLYRGEIHRILGDLNDEQCRELIRRLERVRQRVATMNGD